MMEPFIVDPSEVKREGYRFFTKTAMTLRARDYKDVRMAAVPLDFKSTYQERERGRLK